MKTITIICNNRYRYLEILCDSLSKNKLTNFEIYAMLEPDGNLCKKTIEKYLSPKEIIINNYNFGVTWNSIQAWIYTFDKLKSDFNLFLEEDVVLSPDALNLTNWFVNNYYDDPTKMAIVLHNYTKNLYENNKTCKLSKKFMSFGIGITRKIWYDLYRPNILSDNRGWDFSINNILQKTNNLYNILPNFSRINHIGRYGCHSSPEVHDKEFGDLYINQNIVSENDFILT